MYLAALSLHLYGFFFDKEKKKNELIISPFPCSPKPTLLNYTPPG